ncbi:MAG: TolC family protein [Burkholderiaceae bacterium]
MTLTEMETAVLDANYDMRLARIAVDGARAGVMQADTRPNPVLSLNGASYSPSSGLGGGNVFGKRVDQIVRIEQTFERGNKRLLRIGLADAQLEGKRLDLQEQRREVLQLVRDTWIDLLLTEQRIVVLDETRRSYEASLEAATKRVRAGDLAAADLARLRVEVLRARTDAEAALADHRHAQISLASLLAAPGDAATLQTDGQWPDSMATNTQPASRDQADDVGSRPDVASARLALSAASTAIELARSQRVRDITFGLQFERFPGFGGTGNTIGAGVSIPLFFGNDYGGDVAHALSDRDAAEQTAAKVRAAALADVASARTDLEVAGNKIATYAGGLLEAARSAARSADFAFTRGGLGIMDLMDARRTLLATRLDALNAQADYARALAAVDAAQTRSARRPSQ